VVSKSVKLNVQAHQWRIHLRSRRTMTIATREREKNHRSAFDLMMRELGDRAIDTALFDSEVSPVTGVVLRTTWQELADSGYVDRVAETQYRLTAKGWLAGLELSGVANTKEYQERIGHVLRAMKAHVKGRTGSKVVELRALAAESNEPEGWIFNIIDSRASSLIGSARKGATWYQDERGRLVEIPVDFNLEPVDIAAALTIPHLERIQALEERVEHFEEERAQFHCPYCDAEVAGIAGQDYPEHHAYVTYEEFACGRVTADGFEEVPCPYSPHWPPLDEFEFAAQPEGRLWICEPVPTTERARRVRTRREIGRTKEEAEQNARFSVAPKVKGQPDRRRSWP